VRPKKTRCGSASEGKERKKEERKGKGKGRGGEAGEVRLGEGLS
jgi:hypothetical protein